MPVYEYICEKCGEKFSVLLSMSQKDKAACPRCQSKDLREDFRRYGSAKVNKSPSPGKFT